MTPLKKYLEAVQARANNDAEDLGITFALAYKDVPKLVAMCLEMEKALRQYAGGNHFEYHGKQEFEPETPSGEPQNIQCGGAPGGEFTIEDGWVAREALAAVAKIAEGGE